MTKTADDWFAENMRARREAIGLSQAGLARLMTYEGHEGIHQTTIARMERGERVVRLSEAETIAVLLNTNLQTLLLPRVSVLSQVEDRLGELGIRHKQLRDQTVDYEVARAQLKLAVQAVQQVLDGGGGLSEEDRDELFSAYSREYLGSRLDRARDWLEQGAVDVVQAEMVFANAAAAEVLEGASESSPVIFVDTGDGPSDDE
nr:helix-turn-helix transcriptional regulator [Dermacoccus sp. Tok2021]